MSDINGELSARQEQRLEGCCPVVELRQYTEKPGRCNDLIALFEEHFLEGQGRCGMRVIAQFRNSNDPDSSSGYAVLPTYKRGRKPWKVSTLALSGKSTGTQPQTPCLIPPMSCCSSLLVQHLASESIRPRVLRWMLQRRKKGSSLRPSTLLINVLMHLSLLSSKKTLRLC
jgi:hypothetical protein